jgi:Flp pilus assembly protein TadD
MGRDTDAIADYDRALVVKPRDAMALFGRGIALLKRGRIKAGRADITAAIKRSATVAEEFTGYGLHP